MNILNDQLRNENTYKPADPARLLTDNYSSPSSPPTKAKRNLRGCIDLATRDRIDGWVWDPDAPDRQIEIEVIEGTKRLASFIANRARPGLTNAGISDDLHAFRFDVPSGLLPDKPHTLHLCCSLTGAPVPGSPVNIEQAIGVLPSPLHWHIDEISCEGVVGWVYAVEDPTHRCCVVLKEGTRIHSRATASQFRLGLKEAGVGDGQCAFTLPMPRLLLDGEEHLLDIVEESSGQTLTVEPLSWRFATPFSETADRLCSGGSVVSLYEILHGRNPETSFIIEHAKSQPIRSLFTSIVRSNEFATEVLSPLRNGSKLRHDLVSPYPAISQCCWIASLLCLDSDESRDILAAKTWRDLLTALLPSIEAAAHGKPKSRAQQLAGVGDV